MVDILLMDGGSEPSESFVHCHRKWAKIETSEARHEWVLMV